MNRIDTGQSLSVAKSLGYSGSSNQDFDSWFSNLDELSQEAVRTGNSALVSYIQAYNSTDDPYRRQQLENSLNSYRSQVFEPNFMQRIGEDLFGDTSSRTNFQNQVNDKLIQDVKGIQEGLHTEEFTDPSAEVARRRAAGINDDLNGGSQIGSGEPGAIDEPELAPGVLNDGFNVISEIGSLGSQIVSFAMQAYQGFQSIRALDLDNLSKEIGISDSARSSAWDLIREGVSEFIGKNDFTADELADPSLVALAPSLLESFGSRVNSLPISHRARRKLSSLVDSLVYTYDSKGYKVPSAKYQSEILDQLSKLHKSRHDYSVSGGDFGAKESSISALDAISNDIYKPINKLLIEVSKSSSIVDKLMNQYNIDYYTQANSDNLGSLSAQGDFVSKKLQYELGTIRENITSSFAEINRKLDYNPKLSPNWKMALKTGASIAESIVLTNILNASSSFHFGANFSHRNSVFDRKDTFVHMNQ